MGDETTAATVMATGSAPSARWRVASAMLAVVLAIGVSTVCVAGAGAASETVDECVRRRVAAGETRSVALAACLAASNTTVPASGTPGLNSTSSDGGTSTGLLIAVGLGSAVVGAGIATVLRRRGGAVVTTGSAEPAAALPAMAPPAMVPAAMAQAPAMAPPSAATAVPIGSANNAALVTALIDLSDRVPSQALRAEILAALGRAGVHALVPEVGGAFDATRMRGVGGVPAPEAGWAGRVASVERTGFHDGVSVLRVPEVVVYTVGS